MIFISLNLRAQNESKDINPDETGAIANPTSEQKATIKDVTKQDVTKKANEKKLLLTEKESSKNKADFRADTSSTHRFGLHTDLNVPHIINYGLDYWHSSLWFSTALNFGGYSMNGVAKSSDTPNGLDIKIANQELMFRVHPAKGSFYIGLGYGNHAITVETQQKVSVTTPFPGSADVAISDEIKAGYLLPHIGWLWRLQSGLTFGTDFGYVSPINPTVNLKSNISNISNALITKDDIEATTEYKNARQDLINKSEQFGKMGLPYWAIFRIGWLF